MRKIYLFISVFFAISFYPQKAVNKIPKPIVYNDFCVILHEETLNKVFDVIGEISGTNEYQLLLVKGKYHWTVKSPRIALNKDTSNFFCDAKVAVGPFDYNTPVNGKVKIWYDSEKNQINVKITTAIFEVFTMILGKKFTIKKIDLADYFKDPFQFEGPKTMGTEFEFFTPDSIMRKISITPNDCQMEVRAKEIVTRCEVRVKNEPIIPIPVKVTIQNAGQSIQRTDSLKRNEPKK